MTDRYILLLLVLIMTTVLHASTRELFVAPAGCDANPGTKAHPFATLERARDAVRALKAEQPQQAGGITVCLRGGHYPCAHSFTLSTEDSGTADAPICYRAYRNETVCLSGGKAVGGWAPVTDPAVLRRLPEHARGHILQTDLPAQGITDLGKLSSRGFGRPIQPAHLQLIFQGHSMELARWPHDGFATISGFPANAGHDDGLGTSMGKLEAGFYFASDRPAHWAHPEDAWVHGYWAYDWANSYEHIAAIDPTTHLITTRPPYGNYGFTTGQRFYFLNILEELDQPGEYYLDGRTGLLYFWPPAPLQGAETVVTVLEHPLISLEGVSHVSLCNLTLECTRGDGIVLTGGTQNLIAGCTLRHLGNRAVVVHGGTRHRVAGCDIYDTGDSGISLSGGDRKTLTPGGHVAENNLIHHIACWSRCYQPGIGVEGVGNRVAHNVIHDCPHNGILLGGNDHLIEFNEIYRTCLETGDVGAFYMGRDYAQQGNVIRYNFFHHTGGVGMGSMAVYLDDCSSGVTITGNIFYRTQRAAFIGGGRDNIVDNNIFVECTPAVAIDGRGVDSNRVWQDMVNITMKQQLEAMNYRLPPYRTRYPHLAELEKYFAAGKGVPPEGNKVTHNISVGGQWLELGWHAEAKSVEVHDNLVDDNPHFVDATVMNFQLRDDSPAYRLGFQRIPVEKIGLYQDAYRRAPQNGRWCNARWRCSSDRWSLTIRW